MNPNKRNFADVIFNQPAQYDRFDDMQAAHVQELINSGQLNEAEKIIDRLYPHSYAEGSANPDLRNHRSYFLHAQISFKKGYLSDAYEKYKEAYNQQPQNPQYAEAFRQISAQRARNPKSFKPPKGGGFDSDACCDFGCDVCGCC